MLDAITILLNNRIENEKPNIEKTDNDEILGQKYRAYKKAISIVNGFFLDIQSFKEGQVGSQEFNKSK